MEKMSLEEGKFLTIIELGKSGKCEFMNTSVVIFPQIKFQNRQLR